MSTIRSCELTIFEGPDGGGKSTAAKDYATATGAKYVHFRSLPNVTGRALARMYLEAMLPALHGYQPVVFDRCWLSEAPYGSVFRPHQPFRVDVAMMRMLERVAMRCGTRMVYCLPDIDVCLESFRSRRGEEMLEREEQLVAVYAYYRKQWESGQCALPTILFNYTKDDLERTLDDVDYATENHLLSLPTVGNMLADVCLVGESFAERRDTDNWQQYPFVSFGRQGCSHWLAEYLQFNNISEVDLCWANADFDLRLLDESIGAQHYIALGASAAKALDEAGLSYSLVSHPQYQKRFKSDDNEYILAERVRAILDSRVAAPVEASTS